ncbi:tetraspanin-33-like isoform X1 [Biomphalaria glabrata]|uniref:Tetraspanin n=2 Tax=Biomphalaria TaxID=6525 RepID=A0A9W2YDH9_BIOGL|nr:tetraspanin-33-like isoform X1 [Biomphalaria glabrata]KAK0057700.1 tetraspanin-33 [Biomphalaria pfeifferi]
MACCTSRDTFVNPVLKYILFFFNFTFWLAGLSLLAIGIWAHLQKETFSFEDVRSVFDFITDLSILAIIIGCLMFLLGFCGCLGALRENTCLIKLYYFSLCIIFLGQVGGAVYVFLKSNEFRDLFVKTLKDELIPLYTEREDKKMLVDLIQEKLGCCGMSGDGYRDWNNNQYYNCTKENKNAMACAVPHSCCAKQDTIYPGVTNILCGANSLNEKGSTNIYIVGCVSAVMQVVENNLPIVGGIIIGFAVPQIMGIVLSRTLDGQISDQLARWRRYHQDR